MAAPLASEDYRVQSMPDVSPPWWNLGHTSWFFAKNVLEPHAGYRFENPGLEYALNSYYETHGARLERHRRGLVSRPTTDEVLAFRSDVDERMQVLLGGEVGGRLAFLVETGLQHEQQHQELMVTEIKHILGTNPPALRRAYSEPQMLEAAGPQALEWLACDGGVRTIGAKEEEWAWDNERPRHRVFCEPFEMASRLVTVGEFAEFVDAGGYRDPLLWLANGWAWVQEDRVRAPLYWEQRDGASVTAWTLGGLRRLDPCEPVAHVSFYEADAYANWRARELGDGSRLPSEREWEVAALEHGFTPAAGNFLEDAALHPRPARAGATLQQAAGDLWEWTTSHYEAYPGYRPFDGALMEYNGKFMDNQRVLRGGSCATPRDHVRPSYRNFWPASTQFQFTGLRLARSR